MSSIYGFIVSVFILFLFIWTKVSLLHFCLLYYTLYVIYIILLHDDIYWCLSRDKFERKKKMKWEYIIIECHGSLCFFNTFISDNFGKHYGCSTFASHIYI